MEYRLSKLSKESATLHRVVDVFVIHAVDMSSVYGSHHDGKESATNLYTSPYFRAHSRSL